MKSLCQPSGNELITKDFLTRSSIASGRNSQSRPRSKKPLLDVDSLLSNEAVTRFPRK